MTTNHTAQPVQYFPKPLPPLVLLLFLALVLCPLRTKAEGTKPAPDHYTYKVIASYPHDPGAFTQGLAIDNALLYEGTGRYSESSLRWVDLQSGRPIKTHNLSSGYFGEGITVWGDKIIQLTWRSETGFVYDKQSFNTLREFTYPGEGWGLTHDGNRLIMSDGTATLRFLDPESFAEMQRITVRDGKRHIDRLNELEFVQGKIYANIWQTDTIAIIDPATGQVEAWLDLTGILQGEDVTRRIDVLNGIAYDPATDALYVTGKLWPRLFRIELVRKDAPPHPNLLPPGEKGL